MMLHILMKRKKKLTWREEANEILDKWVIWDWIKCNIRLYSIDYSAKETCES